MSADTEQASELAAAARRLAEGEWSCERSRAVADDPGLAKRWWDTMVTTGWASVLVPEQCGGVDGGVVGATSMAFELGRVLAPADYAATVTACAALRATDTEAARAALRKIADGTVRATSALAGADGTFADRARQITAESSDIGWRLRGRSSWVPNLAEADVVVVAAASDRGDLAAIVDLTDAGVSVVPRPSLDATRSFGDLELDTVVVDASLITGDAAQRARQIGMLLTAADAVGAATRILEISVAYATERSQFGRAIGSFQAVKHRCADMHVRAVGARAAVDEAARRLEDGPARRAVSIAKVAAGDAVARITQDAIQIHGGIGFTWEHDCHLFLRRGRLDQAMFGDSRWHLDRIGALLD